MSDVQSTGALNSLRWQKEEYKVTESDRGMLTQADFFALLTKQLANQDPTKPVDNNEMISQMTAFSTTDGVAKLNEQFTLFASSMTSNQALQASSLVGRSVLVDENIFGLYDGEQVKGKISTEVPASNVNIYVENASGEVVQSIPIGSVGTGGGNFTWDGNMADGSKAPPGAYRFRIAGLVDGQPAELQAQTFRKVDSVTIAGNGGSVLLNLNGGGSMPLSEVVEISEG
ncbi:MAG: flagellar biosynthesis protein FlgD [Gammaproteobacteria bacterium]|nr:MAG: flagellar biosynthesis protein FlgD [Gammaproteobacteria bacterium]